MKIIFPEGWLENLPEDPEGCIYCGAIAGVCDNYPECQEQTCPTISKA